MNHQLESRMREIRLSGSEGGGNETNRFSLPLWKAAEPHTAIGNRQSAIGNPFIQLAALRSDPSVR
ncbi:MAG: hypothetical protein ACREXY_06070, partial [Gammaproteobacteria bacterium]